MTTNDLLEYFEDNEEEFIEVIEELDDYNGYLADDRYYDMDEFDYILSDKSPSTIVEMLSDDFNICDEYFRFGMYGLESADYRDYSEYMEYWFIDEIIKLRDHLCLSEEVEAIIDSIDDEAA